MNRTLLILGAASFVLGISVAIADKLSDFQTAVGNDGCDSIPYGDLRTTCGQQQQYVHPYCDGANGPVTCGSERETRDLKDQLERARNDERTVQDRKTRLEAEQRVVDPTIDASGDLLDAAAAAMEASASRWQSERASGRMSLVQAAVYGGQGTMSLYVALKDSSTRFLGDYKGREAKLTAASDALDRFVSSASAPGQADDAKVLAAQLKAELGKLSTAYTGAVDGFARQHDDNVRNLKDKVACSAEWKALQAKVRAESSASALAEWRRQLDTYFGVDLKTYRDGVQRRLGARLSAVAAAFEREAAAQAEDQRLVDDGARQSERF